MLLSSYIVLSEYAKYGNSSTPATISFANSEFILSKQQALEDYDALWEMLEDNYPYFETIKNELGLDWREVRDTYRTELISVCRGSSILQDFFEANSEADDIIIDIQGNGGGNDVVWMDGIISHISCEPLIQYGMIGVKDGKFNRFMWDAEQPFPSEFQEIDSETWNKTFPDLNMEDFGHLKFYSYENTCTQHEDNICFQGQLWMLIDSSNYSASDAFASFCKATGFARLVGETTGGNGRGGQPYTFALPNSGLLVYFDPYFSLNPDGSCNAIAGTRPDIETKAGMTALETCLEAIG